MESPATPLRLTPPEARVLGSLIEKEITTPDYYPLSLNALVNACNQKSSRDPVMELTEDDVRQALHALEDKHLVRGRGDSRVGKYEHRLQEVFNFSRGETALLCVLLLRGAQTPGELRGRSERLFAFEDLASVQSALDRLTDRQPPLARVLPRQPGTKEARYIELLSRDTPTASTPAAETSRDSPAESRPSLEQRVRDLESRLDHLTRELEALRQKQ